jgi:predicted N-formylglutamate amidohydrolase
MPPRSLSSDIAPASSEAVEVIGTPGQGPFVLTAEHASAAVPPPWTPTAGDHAVLSTHWGWDLGIEVVTRAMASASGSPAALARFTRLLCDANRHPDHHDFVLREAEGHVLSFNESVDSEQIEARRRRFHVPYHAACESLLAAAGTRPLLLVMHSFTPIWKDVPRAMDAGVIFTPDQAGLAHRAIEAITSLGLGVTANDPYAAGGGMAYSLERHGPAFDVPHLELELNQALLADEAEAAALGRSLARVLRPLAEVDQGL